MSVWKVLGSVGIVLWGVRAFQVVGDILEYNDVVSYKSSIIQKIDSFLFNAEYVRMFHLCDMSEKEHLHRHMKNSHVKVSRYNQSLLLMDHLPVIPLPQWTTYIFVNQNKYFLTSNRFVYFIIGFKRLTCLIPLINDRFINFIVVLLHQHGLTCIISALATSNTYDNGGVK